MSFASTIAVDYVFSFLEFIEWQMRINFGLIIDSGQHVRKNIFFRVILNLQTWLESVSSQKFLRHKDVPWRFSTPEIK